MDRRSLNRKKKNEIQRNWSNNRRQQALDILGNKCVVCGSTENLEFDHIDPKKKSFAIGAWGSHSWEEILKELTKCQILCKIDHKKKTEPKHGTYSCYKHRKCKCIACINANTEYMRTYRLARRQTGKVV